MQPAAPSLSTYEAAATSIYQPQLQADITTAQNTEQNDIATEEATKGQVETDYETAINNLTTKTNNSVAKINQLYTEKLGGNFSGLQGNDLGSLFATASQNQTTIEEDRANKLASIATAEANDTNTFNNTVSSLTSKYQGEEADYANTQYTAAVKEYNTENTLTAYQQAELASKGTTAAATKLGDAQTIAASLSKVAGKDGYVSPQSYNQAKLAWVQAGYSASEFDTQFSNYVNPNQSQAVGKNGKQLTEYNISKVQNTAASG